MEKKLRNPRKSGTIQVHLSTGTIRKERKPKGSFAKLSLIAFLFFLGLNKELFAQANNVCANASPIGLNAIVSGNNIGASTDVGWGCSGTNEVFYTIKGTGGTMMASTCFSGTNYDSGLQIMTGSCSNLTYVTCNDDYCGLSAVVFWNSVAGATYYIAVGGWAGRQGNFQLQVTNVCTSPDLPTVAPVNPICFGGSANLNITGGNLGNATAWNWYSGSCGGTYVGSGTSISVSPTQTTTYYVRGEGGCTNPGGCSAVTVVVNNPPAASFSLTNVSCQENHDGSLTINNVSGNGPFEFSKDGGASYIPGGNSYTFNNLGAGIYNLVVKDANGCTTSATKMLGLNRVVNGDFEAGNTGFTTGYHLNSSGIIDEGEYSVEIVPSHGCFQGPDHSPTGAGFAFHANGSSTPNTTAWQQEISVEPNTTYYFSTWIKQQCGAALPQLQFSINGNTIGSVFSPTALFQWQQFFTSWNSGANTTATIRIVNQSLALSGNDFSLDDISFTTVPPLEIASVSKAAATCAAAADGSITVTAQGGTAPYSFSMDNGSNYVSGTSPYTFANLLPGNYTVKIKDNCGFESGAQQVTLGFVDNIKPLVITQPLTIQLDATGNASITAAQVNNGSSDACGVQSLALDITSFNCSNVGANTVTLTVTDVNGNQNSGTAIITVEDKVLPTVVTKNFTVTLANGIATITENDVNDGSNDACGIEYLGLDIKSFDCSNLGANTVTLTGEDNHGNYNSETAIVTVLGAIPAPGISVSRVGANVYTGADEKTIFLGYGNQKAMLSASNATSLAGNTTYSWSPAAGLSDATIANPMFTPTAQGSYTFTVTATNEFGCTATKSETITVINAVCGQKGDKVLVCHNGSEICISANAVPAHLAHHGDKLGSCNPEIGTARIAGTETMKPERTSLKAYPNPFTASTNVEFMLAENGNFKAELLDMKGQLVKVIASEAGKAGETYGYEIGSANLANGIYLVRLVTASEVKILKLVLDK